LENSIKILLVSINIFVLSLIGCNNKSLWKEITIYFRSDTLTSVDLKSTLSEIAIKRIITKETSDSVGQVRKFFHSLEDSKMSMQKRGGMIFIVLDGEDTIAGGPTFEVINKSNNWYINNIRFGK